MRVARIPRASLALCVFLLGILSAEGFKATLLPKSWVAVPHGGTLVLVCTVTGCEPDKPVFFVWRGTGDSSLGGATSTVGHQSNLTVAPVGFDNAQTYICLASCGSERRQTKTDVDVYSLSSDPVISSTPLVAGVPAALTCEVTDVFPSRRCTLRLIRNSHEVEKRTYEDIDDSVEDKTTTLRLQHKFTPFVEDDGTDILCQAQMSFEDPRMEMKPKKRQRSMTLNVNYAPQSVVISESPSATVREGDHLTLNCVAKSNPPPRMTWTKELEKGRVPIGEGDTITFNRANMSDSGVYICEANNEVGSHSTTTEIIVQGPPRSTTLAVYPNATVKAGDIVNITCTSLGEPAPHITLRKKSEAGFTTDQRPYIVLKAEEEHTGVYECESSNDLGSQRTELKLVVQARTNQAGEPTQSIGGQWRITTHLQATTTMGSKQGKEGRNEEWHQPTSSSTGKSSKHLQNSGNQGQLDIFAINKTFEETDEAESLVSEGTVIPTSEVPTSSHTVGSSPVPPPPPPAPSQPSAHLNKGCQLGKAFFSPGPSTACRVSAHPCIHPPYQKEAEEGLKNLTYGQQALLKAMLDLTKEIHDGFAGLLEAQAAQHREIICLLSFWTAT
ncbi:vascular cell adhesion protein 1 isoform X1 [Lissotriton helveticus]